MVELSTLGSVIKTAYEGQANTNAYTDAEKAKLSGIDDQATRNATDAELRDRSTHTGMQMASSIVDLPDVLAGKVDAVPGKSLSDANFTQAEKDKLAGLEDAHFKGVHVGLTGLQDAHPTGQAGDYAVVDDGSTLTWYQWSATEWVARIGESTEITPAQVKAYYESNPDTNAYTNAHKSVIDAIINANRFTWRRVGTWNASTNTPALLDGTGQRGDFYVVTTAGSHNFGNGNYSFLVGDFVIYEGGTWKRLSMAESVRTVNGKNGAVALNAADVGARSSTWVPAWGDVTGKPDFPNLYAKKSRGGLSAPIQAAYYWRNAATPLPSVTNTNWIPNTNAYDYFGMLSGGVITLPSWARRVRVTGGFVYESNDIGTRYAGISLNGAIIATTRINATLGGLTSVNLVTPIWAVTGATTLTFTLHQNSGTTINAAASCWANIELFEDA